MIPENFAIRVDASLAPETCSVPGHLLLALQVKPDQPVTIFAGNRQARANLKESNFLPQTISISPATAAQLYIPPELNLDLMVLPGRGTLRLGPFIAIYGYKNLAGRRIFSEQTSYFRKLCQVSRKMHALTYVVAPEDLNINAGFTYGHVLEKSATGLRWTKKALPLPDVFYDRGLFPKGPYKMTGIKVRRYLRAAWGDKFFNPKFFDKWRTHLWLSEHAVLRRYLPTTVHIQAAEAAKNFIARHSSVYLKPSGGSSGRGILRVRRDRNSYICEYLKKKVIYRSVYGNLDQMWQDLLDKQMLNKKFIVQQDLNLAQYQARPFDVRVLMQKGLDGKWRFTGMAARLGGSNAITTNLHAGGTAQPLEQILSALFGAKKAYQMQSEIEHLSFLTCSWVEQVSGLQFGEIAVDVGIDNTGKIWLIELNAVPGRTVFTKIGPAHLTKQAVSRPIEYALYLAGFGKMQNNEQELI
ncbi:YheC/YheD family protein [Thermincola potens]|uniref:ATP-grasp domain-containing protein n=1 Tax=Thermincola potens (strain JR) TaxID=635013 RepID=D5XE97_THEPJ|nr:YheC/YheD family protein [Thermincola potens]ADG81968.1 hypothetical protein TherJR_1104 [Thermincola potens JR]